MPEEIIEYRMMPIFGGYWALQEAPMEVVQKQVQVWQAEVRAEKERQRRAEEEQRRNMENNYGR